MAEKKKSATTKAKKVVKKAISKKTITSKKVTAKRKVAPKKVTKKTTEPVMEFPINVPPSGETYSYKGWLNSDSFVKRCFAVLGYNFVGTLMLYGVIIVIALVIMLLTVGISALVS